MTKLSLFPRASKHDVETKKFKGESGKKACFPQNNLNINSKLKLMIKSNRADIGLQFRYFDRFMVRN
ncbi:hypothetical protein [Acinetobacter sp. AS5]|uniref:hypothetical protein n=1 Tax=Acinetobacter sp. AS5 TaxID=3029187 RepID=UPI0028D606E8|nr:hypothetical protein [Acinetobacter lwoffii]